MVYTGISKDRWDIHLFDLWRRTDRRITNSPEKQFTPVFAPDGAIVYTRVVEKEPVQMDLYRIPGEQVFDSQAPVRPAPFIADPEVLEYNPAFSGTTTFSFQSKPALPDPPRSSFGAVAYGGRIYVAGGHRGPEHTYPPESFLDRLDIYDPGTQTWTPGAAMSVPRQGFEMVAYDGYLYAFGGFAYSGENSPPWRSLNIIERYDVAHDRWEVLSEPLPHRRSSNIAARVGTKVYLIGGWDSTPRHPGDMAGHFHRQIDVFDLRSLKASTSDHELVDPLRRAFTAVVYEGRIILLGGISEGASHFDWIDNVTVFNPGTGRWLEMPPLPFATFAPGAGVYRCRLFLFGGMTRKSRYQDTIYAFNLYEPGDW